MVSARKPSNAKLILFVKLNYLPSYSQVRPNDLRHMETLQTEMYLEYQKASNPFSH